MNQNDNTVGLRKIDGWILHDVDDRGNCFYDTIIHQLGRIGSAISHGFDDDSGFREHLRSLVADQQAHRDGEWADDDHIFDVVKGLNIVLGIVDTRYPPYELQYMYNNRGLIWRVFDLRSVPAGLLLLRVAYTGNHYLSVIATKEELCEESNSLHGQR